MPPVTLDGKGIAEQACEQTGLTDFGEDSWQEGLERLVDSFRTEAALNELGGALVEGELLGYLSDRLQIELHLKPFNTLFCGQPAPLGFQVHPDA